MPGLIDDGPRRVVEPLFIVEEDGQEGYTRQEAPAPEQQDAPPVSAGAFRRHDQHGEAPVPGPSPGKAPVRILADRPVQATSP